MSFKVVESKTLQLLPCVFISLLNLIIVILLINWSLFLKSDFESAGHCSVQPAPLPVHCCWNKECRTGYRGGIRTGANHSPRVATKKPKGRSSFACCCRITVLDFYYISKPHGRFKFWYIGSINYLAVVKLFWFVFSASRDLNWVDKPHKWVVN